MLENLRIGKVARRDRRSDAVDPILEEFAEVIGRITAERGFAVLAVEQNPRLRDSRRPEHLVMEKGEIIAEVATAESGGDRALQRKYLAL